MTSLQDLLPEPGTSNWRKAKSYSTDSADIDDATVRHVVIREVWLENRPTPHAVYKVDVMSRSAHWSVFRRYREFYQLHQTLMKKYGIPKDLLPPRKFANSLAKDTLYKRREALEHFMQRVINSSGRGVSCCDEVLDFLDVKSHDVSLVSHTLAKHFKEKGEMILSSGQGFQFTPSQLYCITRQLRLPHPWTGHRVDLSYLYDFISHIQKVTVSDLVATASKGQQHMSNVSYDVSLFSSLKDLQLDGCQTSYVKGLSSLPAKLSKLSARYSVKSMKELLVDNATETRKAPKVRSNSESWRTNAALKLVENRMIVQPWVCLTHVNFSHNYITTFDSSFSIIPAIKELDLSYNHITHLDLTYLVDSPLKKLSLVANEIYLISGSTKTNEELVELNLRLNRIHTIEGLLCLQALESLDLAHNSIVLMAEIRKLGALPRLGKLWVAGNPIAKRKRHRIMALYYFRLREFELDGKRMTSKERAKIESKLRSKEDSVGPDDNLSISTVSDDDLDSGIDEHGQPSRLEPLLEDEYLIIGRNLEPINLSQYASCASLDKNESRTEQEEGAQSLDDDTDVISESRSRDEWDRILQRKSSIDDQDETGAEDKESEAARTNRTLLAQSKAWEENAERVSVFERLSSQESTLSQVSGIDVQNPHESAVKVRTKSKVEHKPKNEVLDAGGTVKKGTLLYQWHRLHSQDGSEDSRTRGGSDVIQSTTSANLECPTNEIHSAHDSTKASQEISFEWSHFNPRASQGCSSVDNVGQCSGPILRVGSIEEIQAVESSDPLVSLDDECEKAEECEEEGTS